MTEEITNPNVGVNNNEFDTTQNYIDAIAEMKRNSVSRSEYEKVREENKTLLQSIINGETIAQPQVAKEPVDIDALRKDLFGKDHNNLQFVQKALELRSAIIEQGGADPFLPKGHNITLSPADYETANKVAEAFEHCIEYADGDSEIFTNELMRITQDSFRPNFKNIKRR